MPVYEYLCDSCGDFTEIKPMAAHADPQPCPGCDQPSPRAILTPPRVAICSSTLRAAHRRNEASAMEPKRGRLSGGTGGAHAHGHGHGHAHAHPARAGRRAGGRPWMLSH